MTGSKKEVFGKNRTDKGIESNRKEGNCYFR